MKWLLLKCCEMDKEKGPSVISLCLTYYFFFLDLMVTGVSLVLFLMVPLITNSEYSNNIYLVLEYPEAVLLEVVIFVTLHLVLNLGFSTL